MITKMLRIFLLVMFLNVPLSLAEDKVAHLAFTKLLEKYVSNGEVNYKSLCKDESLGEYLKFLVKTDPSVLSKDEELALWINAYNAYMLKAVCDHYPLKSLNQLHFGGIVTAALLGKTVWDKPIAVVGGKKYNLKTIDHGVIRTKFTDPRLQFAMACGAMGCPHLRAEAYEASTLDAQLTDQAKQFFNDAYYNTFDIKKKKAVLSPLLNWNAKYFGKDLPSILAFIAQFMPADIAESLKNSPQEWTVGYGKYALTVNDQH